MADKDPSALVTRGLLLKYGQDTADAFMKYKIDEDFDEETVVEEISGITDYSDCGFITAIAETEKCKDTFATDESKKEMWEIMKNALNSKFEVGHNTGIVDPTTIVWRTKRDDIKKTKGFMAKHCPLLKNNENDQALIDVIAAGQKQKMPLLQWLCDTHTRYRVNSFVLSNKDIQKGNWLREYKYFANLKTSGKQKLMEKLNSSIQSFHTRVFGSIMFQPAMLIDDDINEMIDYVAMMDGVIKRLLADNKNEITPLQIDLWIIPSNVVSNLGGDEDEDPDEKENDNVGDEMIGNIDVRLNSNDVKFDKFSENAPDKIGRRLTELLTHNINDKRNKRYVILADRRNPKHGQSMDKPTMEKFIKQKYCFEDSDEKKGLSHEKWKDIRKKMSHAKKDWKDTIYLYQPKEYDVIPAEHIPESSFWSTTQYMLPTMKGENRRSAWGSQDSMNGFQFAVSYHIDASDVIRQYWFHSTWGIRMLLTDCYLLWPHYFTERSRTVKKGTIEKIKNMQPIQDDRFVQWYGKTTQQELVLSNM